MAEHEKRDGDWQAGDMWFRPVSAHASEQEAYEQIAVERDKTRFLPIEREELQQQLAATVEALKAVRVRVSHEGTGTIRDSLNRIIDAALSKIGKPKKRQTKPGNTYDG